MTPLFSIIVPVYNTEKYLDECIESVISQSCSEWELLLIDDGSTDCSGTICDKYAKEHHNIFTHHQKNEGQFSARKNGISHASGTYYIFLDSDDFLEPDALTILKNLILSNKCDVIMYDSYHFEGGQKKAAEDNIDFCDCFFDKKEIISQCFLKRTSRISMCAYCFNKELFKNSFSNTDALQNTRSQEDFLMVYDLILKANSLNIINVKLYNYRYNSNSTSHNLSYEMFYKGMNISSAIYSEIINNYGFDVKKDFDNYIIKRLSWLPLSCLARYAVFNSSTQLKKEYKKIKRNFLYDKFTKHFHFKSKLYRFFLYSMRLRLFRLAKKIAKRIFN